MYDDVQMCVTDYDEGMVGAARERLAPFAGRAECRQADATALPFDDGSFDTVVSWIMLHHTVEWEKTLAEATRVLRHGGQLVGYDLLATRPLELLHRNDSGHHRFIRREELRPALLSLPLENVDIRIGRGGVVARFRASSYSTMTVPSMPAERWPATEQ